MDSKLYISDIAIPARLSVTRNWKPCALRFSDSKRARSLLDCQPKDNWPAFSKRGNDLTRQRAQYTGAVLAPSAR